MAHRAFLGIPLDSRLRVKARAGTSGLAALRIHIIRHVIQPLWHVWQKSVS